MKRVDPRWPSPLAVALILTGALNLAVAFAAPPEPSPNAGIGPHAGPFSIHDLDRDGVLSREEYHQFLTALEQRRRAADESGKRYPPPLRFEEIDRNADGYLSEDEMISALNRRLERHKRYRNRSGRW